MLLYQLLTGTTPISRETVRQKAVDELLRCIREQDPPKPSTRLSESKEKLPTISAQRKLPPAQITRIVRGDLDWIVMKALEKDRNRRYETANGLAIDLQRHLQHEPVLARPPTTVYRLRKFIRKHRWPVAAAAGFAVLLTAASVVSTAFGLWANREKARAVSAQGEATANLRQARESEAEARAILKFFEDKVLAAGRPAGEDGGLGWEATIRASVNAAERSIGDSFSNRPIVEASIRDTLARSYQHAGDYANAIRQHERAVELFRASLGVEHRYTIIALNNLATSYLAAGRFKDALPLLEQAVQFHQARLGEGHPETLTRMHNLAQSYLEAGRYEEALSLFEKTVRLREARLGLDHRYTLASMDGLGRALRAAGHLSEAVSMLEKTLNLAETKLGPTDSQTLGTMGNLANAYQQAGQWTNALPLRAKVVKRRSAKYGPDAPQTLISKDNLAATYEAAGRLQEGLALREEALRLRQEKLGRDNPDTLASMNNLAVAYRDLGRLFDALPLHEEAVKLSRANLGLDHPKTLLFMNSLAVAYLDVGRLSNAIALGQQTFELAKANANLGPNHPETIRYMKDLAVAYERAGRTDDAKSLSEQATSLSQAEAGQRSPTIAAPANTIPSPFRGANQWPETEASLHERLNAQRKTLDPDSVTLASTMSLLGESLLRQKKYAEAEPLIRDCLAIFEKKQPGLSPTFGAQSLLGWSLLGSRNFTNAEPLLLQAYEGLKRRDAQRPSPTHAQALQEAGERIVQLYEAWGKPDQAAEWRKKLNASPSAPTQTQR